ncbi:MAG: adenosylcobinamide-phosphate synthase [Paraglaciecola sp.]|jgi:adenosylcobinamide-phosphate synthase
MSLFEPLALLTHPVLQPFWVLVVVVAIDQLWAWPDKYHPLSLAKLLAIRMANKVHPTYSHRDPQRSKMQQKISGTLGFLILIAPFITILAILISFAHFPLFFEAVLLLMAIQFQVIIKQSSKVSDALVKQKKALARHLVSNLILRETENLSPVGIAKASIESLLLRFNQQFFTVIFWYFIFGGIGALTYRLLYEFSHCWNTKIQRFTYFGSPLAQLVAVLQWLPVRLAALALILGQDIGAAIKAYRNLPKHKNTHMLLLALQGGALGIELSGPSYYNKVKVRSPKCGGERVVRHIDIKRSISAVQKAKIIILVVCFLLAAIFYAWR